MSRRAALVTGSTSGIGLSFATALAGRGYHLVLVARNEERLRGLADELRERDGVEVEVIAADLADRSQLAVVEARVADPARPVDLLVNNAGFGLKHKFLDNEIEAEQAMLDVLVTAVLRLSHAAVKQMVARGSGAVVNVSSMASYLPRGTYSAAKAYVTSFTQWLDLTYRDQGVRAMTLQAGFTKTEFHQRMDVSRSSVPRWMWLDADRLVRDALDDLDRGRRVSIPGKRYKALSVVARYTPPSLQAKFQAIGRR